MPVTEEAVAVIANARKVQGVTGSSLWVVHRKTLLVAGSREEVAWAKSMVEELLQEYEALVVTPSMPENSLEMQLKGGQVEVVARQVEEVQGGTLARLRLSGRTVTISGSREQVTLARAALQRLPEGTTEVKVKSAERHTVRLRGLPFSATEQDIREWFRPTATCLAVHRILKPGPGPGVGRRRWSSGAGRR